MRPNTPETFWSKVDRTGPGCHEWTAGRSANGYGSVNYQGRAVSAHRLAWELTYGPIPPGLFVCHQCDNKLCCRATHLFLAGPAVNSADMVAKGRAAHVRGTARTDAKLTAAHVREARARYAAGGVSTHQLARQYGVSSMVMWRAVTGRSYRDVA